MRAFFIVAFCACVSAFAQPVVTAKSAIVMDAESGIILYQKDARAARFPASTTKIITALLLLEQLAPGEFVTAASDCDTVQGSSLHLVPGERISRDDALYALMLRSANDLAHSIAVQISGSDESFAELMNQKAQEIGCQNTHFHNPHGLNDDLHSTCAYDLALIAREAMRSEEFRAAVSTQKRFIQRSMNQKDLLMKNHDKLLFHDSSLEGIKTGYTKPAGQCFVGSKSVRGWRLISVVMASKDWKTDTQALYKWAYGSFERKMPMQKGQVVGDAPVAGGREPSVPGRLDREFSIVCSRGGISRSPEIEWKLVTAPVFAGQTVGVIKSQAPDGQVLEAPIVAASSVDSVPVVLSARRGWSFWVLLAAAGGAGVFLGRKRRLFRA